MSKLLGLSVLLFADFYLTFLTSRAVAIFFSDSLQFITNSYAQDKILTLLILLILSVLMYVNFRLFYVNFKKWKNKFLLLIFSVLFLFFLSMFREIPPLMVACLSNPRGHTNCIPQDLKVNELCEFKQVSPERANVVLILDPMKLRKIIFGSKCSSY